MTIENQIRTFINENFLFGDETVQYTNDDSFIRKGIVDSIAILELVMFVQEAYHIKVQDQEITPDNFDSINSLAKYIQSKQNLETPSE